MNPTILISYDLVSPSRDYANLHAAIKSLSPCWAKPLESCWMITSNLNVAQIRDKLLPHIDANDELFVAASVADWACFNLPEKVVDWLRASVV